MTGAWGGGAVRPDAAAWMGPASVLVIVAAMYAFTALGFELMLALPVAAPGGGGPGQRRPYDE